MNTLSQLYRPYDPRIKHPFVFKKDYSPGDVRIFLRPLFIPDDFAFYNQWVNEELTSGKLRKKQPAFSQSYFEAVLQSSNAQSLWGMINGEPAFEVDMYKATDYPFAGLGHFRLGQNDIILQLLITPVIISDLLAEYIIPACLDYLSLFQGAGRVLLLTDQRPSHYSRLALEAGPARDWHIKKDQQVYEFQLNIRSS